MGLIDIRRLPAHHDAGDPGPLPGPQHGSQIARILDGSPRHQDEACCPPPRHIRKAYSGGLAHQPQDSLGRLGVRHGPTTPPRTPSHAGRTGRAIACSPALAGNSRGHIEDLPTWSGGSTPGTSGGPPPQRGPASRLAFAFSRKLCCPCGPAFFVLLLIESSAIKLLQLLQPDPGGRHPTGHPQISSGRYGHGTHLGAVRQAGPFKLLGEEPAVEGL